MLPRVIHQPTVATNVTIFYTCIFLIKAERMLIPRVEVSVFTRKSLRGFF